MYPEYRCNFASGIPGALLCKTAHMFVPDIDPVIYFGTVKEGADKNDRENKNQGCKSRYIDCNRFAHFNPVFIDINIGFLS